MTFMTFHILGIIILTVTHSIIFQRGRLKPSTRLLTIINHILTIINHILTIEIPLKSHVDENMWISSDSCDAPFLCEVFTMATLRKRYHSTSHVRPNEDRLLSCWALWPLYRQWLFFGFLLKLGNLQGNILGRIYPCIYIIIIINIYIYILGNLGSSNIPQYIG